MKTFILDKVIRMNSQIQKTIKYYAEINKTKHL